MPSTFTTTPSTSSTPIADSISAAVAAALEQAPDAGNHGAFLVQATTDQGVHAVLVARAGDHVQLAVVGGVDVNRKVEGGVAAKVVW